MSTRKNYYVCLRFQGRPDLHLTLSYFKDLSPTEMAEIVDWVRGIVAPPASSRFEIEFSLEAWYGPRHTVRALEPTYNTVWPRWLMELTTHDSRDQTYSWHPHIATKTDRELRLTVIAVSLMCKKTEICRWDLT
jgi:hypothetical protein